MTDLRKAAEDLLEGVEAAIKAGDWKVDGACDPDSAIVRLRQALAQPEWVCCVCGEPEALGIVHSADAPCFHYTKREWVGLTEANIYELMENEDEFDFARAIEAKLKEKNT